MTRLGDIGELVLDHRKLEDYVLNPSHPRGRHKARVFQSALGLERRDAVWLRDHLLAAAVTRSRARSRLINMAADGAPISPSHDKTGLSW